MLLIIFIVNWNIIFIVFKNTEINLIYPKQDIFPYGWYKQLLECQIIYYLAMFDACTTKLFMAINIISYYNKQECFTFV